jgi:hypothetical protein
MKNHKSSWVMAAAALFMVVGCESPTAAQIDERVETQVDAKQAEAWASQDNPSLFSGTLELRFDQLPTSGEAASIPWAGSYWPTYEDSINHKWAGAGSDSPSKKYETAFGGTAVEDAVSRYHGIDSVSKACTDSSTCDSALGETCAMREGRTEGRCVATWWGICHAWTPAAILLPEPRYPVTRNGVTFQVQDLKALASLVHNSTQTKFVSLRCNKQRYQADGGGIRLDQYGRPVDADRECRDTNAGTYHVLLANYLGLMRQSFAEDRVADYQVWNQPLRSYRITSQRDVSALEANALVGASNDPDGGAYLFNPRATRFVAVQLEVKYISESSSATGYIGTRIDSYSHTDRYEYVLELGADGKIIGGEWTGWSKNDHPDFLWLPLGPAQSSVAGGAIKYAEVKAMVLESAAQSTPTDGGVGSQVEVREAATMAAGEWRHFGPYPTTAGPITATMSGTGDPDLYTRLDGQPSLNLFDCRPYSGDANESCQAQGPGAFYVSVHAYSAASIALVINYSGTRPTDGGVVLPDAGPVFDGGSRPDAGPVFDAGSPDAGPVFDGGSRPDAGPIFDGGSPDAGPLFDGGSPDAGPLFDGGSPDAGPVFDGGSRPDAGPVFDGGSRPDAGPVFDAGSPDAGPVFDAGSPDAGPVFDGGSPDAGPVFDAGFPDAGPVFDGGVAHLNVSGTAALSEFIVFSVPVVQGRTIVVRTLAPRDVDVYVRLNSPPTLAAYDRRAFTGSGNETLSITPTASGTLYIGVHGYQASSFTLTTADQ